jgi:tetratricopeptide (TPR) repeat protein
MEALLAELAPPASSGTRGFVIALSLVALAALAGGLLWWSHGRVEAGCGDGGAAVEAVWNGDRRTALIASLGAGGPNYAADVADRVGAVFDDYAARWKQQHRASCEATRHGNQSSRLLERSMACLRVRLRRLDELTDALTASGSSAAETAVGSASALPAVADCGDAERLENQVDPPSDPAVRAQVDGLRDDLARVTALGDTGAYPDARALAEASVARAEALDYPPVAAEALERRGTVEEKMGEYAAAVKSLDRAYFLARSSGSDELAASIAADLVWINGAHVSDIDEAKRWAQHALADAARAGEGSEVQAKAFNGVGIMYTHLQDYEQAEPMLREALEIRRRGGQPLLIAQALHAVAMPEEGKGKYAEAIANYEQILTLVRTAQGPKHPNAVYALVGLGTAEFTRGNYREALGHYELAREIAEAALGPDHARTGEVYENIALCLTSLGRHDEAIPMLERSLEAAGKRNGTNHPSYAQTAMNLGVTLMQAKRYDEAAPKLDLAADVFGAALGADSPWVGMAVLNRAEVDLQRERYDDALPLLARAVDIYAAASPRHEMHAKALASTSIALRHTRKTRAAVAAAREAVDIVVASEAGAATRGSIRLTYARALWQAGDKKSRATAMDVAGQAREDFVAAEDTEEVANVEAWIARPD